jgi:hypothetical protein
MAKLKNQGIPSSRMALALCTGVLLTACATPYSDTPTPTNFATSKQLKLQAGAHWNAIAQHAADSLMNSLKVGKGCVAAQPECQRVYVRAPKEASEFSQAFRTQFITALVNSGVAVAKNPGGAMEIEFDVQVVKFSPKRLPAGTFESIALIAGGVWALHGLWEHSSVGTARAVSLAALAAIDAHRWLTSDIASGPTPQLEILLTVSASNAAEFLGRVTNIYYVADSDETLYQAYGAANPAPLYGIPVKGGE